MKPSILHVITTIDRGGAENHLLELARVQVKTGHKVTVAYLKGAAEQKENFRSAGVEVIAGGKNFFAQFAKIHKLSRLYGVSFRDVVQHLMITPLIRDVLGRIWFCKSKTSELSKDQRRS